MSRQRLQKALAGAGVCSRRRAERLVTAGRVWVNGVPVSDPGSSVDPARDRLWLDGRLMSPKALEHWIAHKPRGAARPGSTPLDAGIAAPLDPTAVGRSGAGRLFAVGRMAAWQTGLQIFTNDGSLACRVASPDCPLDEDYLALVVGRPTSTDLRRLRRATASCAAMGFRLGTADAAERGWWLTIAGVDRASRGRLRALLQNIGHPILELKRTRLGPLHLGPLELGERRRLTPDEKDALCAALEGARSA